MHQMVFENADGILSAGKIGEAKVIRIFRTQAAKKENKRDALRSALVQDIQFLTRHQGEIEKFSGKSRGEWGSSIIIMKHKNKSLSHIAVNLYEDMEIGETFRLEVAGKDGLIEYDSDKSRPVIFNAGGCGAGQTAGGAAGVQQGAADPQILRMVDDIMNGLEVRA